MPANLKPWQLVLLGLLALLTTLSAGYFSRDYSAKKEAHELQVQVTEAKLVSETAAAQVLYKEHQISELQLQVVSLRKRASEHDRGSRITLPNGKVIENWDRGSSSEEDSLQEVRNELAAISQELAASETKAKTESARADRLETEKHSLSEEIKRAGFRGAVLAGWSMGAGEPLERAQIQGLGALGPILMGFSLAPGGPWARPGAADGFGSFAGALRPACWLGMKL